MLWCEGSQLSTKRTRSPASTVKSETVASFSPKVCTGGSLRSHTESGPATATRWWSVRRTHGTTRA